MAAANSFDVATAPGRAGRLQRMRRLTQGAFFVLFVVAPVFDLFRYDLTQGHAWILGQEWHLGLDALIAAHSGGLALVKAVLERLLLPVVAVAVVFLAIAWRWGRIYCGWLCPHFSVVETINRAMSMASGRPSIWDRAPQPQRHPDGQPIRTDARWWFVTVPLAVGFAAAWAVVLLTYLMPPLDVYRGLWQLSLSRNEWIFIAAATTVLSVEFLFARHLFCRYGCAVGLFQSLAWMSNRNAMVIGFARPRAADCATCFASSGPGQAACETACPMRLKPRVQKAQMFTCTQCAQCNAACATVHRDNREGALLNWVDGDAARRTEARVSLTGQRDPRQQTAVHGRVDR